MLELLSDEGRRRLTPAELAKSLGAGEDDLGAALDALCEAAVLSVADGRVSASAATRRLDELELIGI